MNTWIGIPFLSAFLFVMGGILVGHLLWYRDRSRDLRAVKEAESKYNKAKAAARDRKHQFIGLSRDAQTFEKQCQEYRSEVESLRATLASQKEHAGGLETEMGKLLSEHSRFKLAYQDAQQQRDAALDRAEGSEAELEQLRTNLQAAEARFEESANKMQDLAAAADRAAAEIGKQQNRGDQLSSEIDGLKLRCDELTQFRDEALQQRDQAISQRDQALAQRDQFGSERSELSTARDQFEIQRDELTAQRDDIAAQRDQFAVQRDEIAAQRDQLLLQRDQLASEQAQATAQTDEYDGKFMELQKEYSVLRDQYETAIQTTQQQSQEFQDRQADVQRLEEALELTTVQVQTMQAEHDELLDQLDERTARIQTAIDGRVTAETALNQMEAQLESLHGELSESQQLRAENEAKFKEINLSADQLRTQTEELSESLHDKDQSIESLQKQIAVQDEAITRHRGEIQRLQSFRPEFEKLKESVAMKTAALAKAESELRSRQEAVAQLQMEVQSRDGKIAALTQGGQEIGAQISDQTEVIGRLRGQLQNAAAELDASLDANATMQERIRLIESQLHENAVAMRDLRRKRANVPTLSAATASEQRKTA